MFPLLFGGIAATWGLYYLRRKSQESGKRFFQRAVILLGVLMALEPLVLSHLIMRSSSEKTPVIPVTGPWPAFQNTRDLLLEGETMYSMPYRAIKMNKGSLSVSYDPYFTIERPERIGSNEPGYIGEFHQAGKVVEPTVWSPNRIIFKGLQPAVPLTVNMNPGYPWYNKDEPLFPQHRIVEFNEPFMVLPDKDGSVDLVYHRPGHMIGITGTIILGIISLCIIIIVDRYPEFKAS